ncbi:MAG: flagellar protein [Eubacterium sp.]|nr:flagellar protein [Eubacterium sp.]
MINVNQTNYASIEQIRNRIEQTSATQVQRQTVEEAPTFGEVLSNKANELKFSKHASQRLETRNIDVSEEVKARLEDATNQAREKGIKESLVLVDNLAFIVNVKNNTVVTAVNDIGHAVFTNIDGAIIN